MNRTRIARRSQTPRNRQSGVALLVALVLLVAVTLLGVSAMQSTILQERMSANYRDVEEAFNAAELALSRGEADLVQNFGNFLDTESWREINDVPGETEGGIRVTDHGLAHIVADPVYHLGRRGTVCPPDGFGDASGDDCHDIFTVTAFGTGRSTNTLVVLQSSFRPIE